MLTLEKYQSIESIMNSDLPDIDKTLFSICALYGYTPDELDAIPRKAIRLMDRVVKDFKVKNVRAKKRIGKYRINYKPETLTLGQYIELMYYLTFKPHEKANFVLASISYPIFGKNDHNKKADFFEKKDVWLVLSCYQKFIQEFLKFNERFVGVFGESEANQLSDHFFIKRFGWVFSATQIAEMERITLEEAYKINIVKAFNGLAYLKSKSDYEKLQMQINGR